MKYLRLNVQNFAIFVLLGSFLLMNSVYAASELAQTYTLDGQLTQKSNGQVLLDTNAKIVVQIMDPTKTCLLYEEQQFVNTSTSDGYFNIQVGSATGAAKRTVNDAGRSMYQIFQNTSAISANNVSGQTCAGSTYTPTANDVRYFRLVVTPSSTGTADTLSPDTVLNAVPMATVAESLQGYKANQFLLLGTGDVTQSNIESVFATGNSAKLLSLLSVSASNYITKDSTSGLIQIPSGSGTPTGVAAGQIWYDSGNLKFYNGSSVLTVVNSNTTISGSNITSGTIGGSTSVNTTGTISATGFSATTASLNNLLLYDSSNAHKITMKAPSPASLTADYTLTWPSAVASSSGQVLTSDTSGNLSWSSSSGGGTVAVNAPLTNSGTASAANLSITQSDSTHDGYLSSTNWNTFNNKLSSALTSSQIFVGNSSNVATGVVASGDVSLASTGAFTVSGIKGVTVSAAPTVSGQVLRYNGTNITPNFVSMTDLRSQVTGATALASSCGSNQTLTYNTASDNLQCTNISITASQVSNLSSSAFVNGGNSFGGAASLGTSDNNDLNIKTNNSTKMTVTKTGNVGINDSSPNYPLDVNGVAHFGSYVMVDSYLASGGQSDGALNNAYWAINGGSNNGTGSRIGFETYNSGYASLIDNAYIDSVMTSNTVGSESSYFAVSTMVSGTNAERMRIHSNGNVGIGTTSPSAKLDVRAADNTTVAYFGNTSTPVSTQIQSLGASRAEKIVMTSPDGSDGLIIHPGDYTDPQSAIISGNSIDFTFGNSGNGWAANWGAPFYFETVAGQVGLTASSGVQSYFGIAPKINQSGTASYSSLLVNTTETTTGSGEHKLLELQLGGTTKFKVTSAGNIGFSSSVPNSSLDLSSKTDAISLPVGTTAQRPSSATAGMLRYNSSTPGVEYYNGSAWTGLGGGSVGSTLTSIDSITGGTSGLQLSAGGTNQNLTLSGSGTGGVTTGSVTTITNNTTSSGSTSGALVVTGGVGVGGALNVAGNFSTSGTATVANSLKVPIIYGSSAASGTLTLDSTSNATKGNIFLAPSGGNVGIGTSSPSANLHIVNSTSSVRPLLIKGASGQSADFLNVTDSADASIFRIASDKNIYIPAAGQLIVNGASTSLNADGLTLNSSGKLAFTSTSNYYDTTDVNISRSAAGVIEINNGTAGAYRDIQLRAINPSSGNVGIGTTSPAYKLDVAGDINTSTNYKIGGSTFLYAGNAVSKHNLFAGVSAGNTSLTGTGENIGIGYASMSAVTTGYSNVSLGSYAGNYITTQYNNTAVGYEAYHYGIGIHNSAFGNMSLLNGHGDYNTSIGDGALYGVTTGDNNVALGVGAGSNLSTGSSNVFIGPNAGPSSSTSLSNKLYIGNAAGTPLIYGDFSAGKVGIGTTSPATTLHINAPDNTTVATFQNAASSATFEVRAHGAGDVQYLAFKDPGGAYDRMTIVPPGPTVGNSYINTSGALNLVADYNGWGVSNSSTEGAFDFTATGGLTSTANLNSFVFMHPVINQSGTAGYNGLTIDVTENTTGSGSKNLLYLSNGGTAKFVVNSSGSVAIAKASPSYPLDVVGDINTTSCFRVGATTVGGTCSSDERLKENIQSYNDGLDKLINIQLHSYTFNGLGGIPKSDDVGVGVLAQELEKTNPELVKTRSAKLHPDDKENTEIKVVDYSKFPFMLINAVKELYAKWQTQDRDIASLKSENEELKKSLNELKAYVCGKDSNASICH